MAKRLEANLAVKRRLSDALFELLEEKGMGSVGISELVERAGVARASFYRNFDSLDEVLAYGLELLSNSYMESCPYDYVDFLDVECVAWNLSFWRRNASRILLLSSSGLSAKYLNAVFRIAISGPKADPGDPSQLKKRNFAIGAFYTMALDWLMSGCIEDEAIVARNYCAWLGDGIR